MANIERQFDNSEAKLQRENNLNSREAMYAVMKKLIARMSKVEDEYLKKQVELNKENQYVSQHCNRFQNSVIYYGCRTTASVSFCDGFNFDQWKNKYHSELIANMNRKSPH